VARIGYGEPWSEAPGKAGIPSPLQRGYTTSVDEPQSRARYLAGEPRR
jgi:hypothetical protein